MFFELYVEKVLLGIIVLLFLQYGVIEDLNNDSKFYSFADSFESFISWTLAK